MGFNYSLFEELKKYGLREVNFMYGNNPVYWNAFTREQKKIIKTGESSFARRLFWIIPLLILISTIPLSIYWNKIESPWVDLGSRGQLQSSQVIMDIVLNQNDPQLIDQVLAGITYVDIPDEYGWTPLHWALFLEKWDLARALARNGASTRLRSTRSWFKFPAGTTPLDILKDRKFLIKRH